MKKTLVGVAAILSLTIALVGCSGGSSDSSSEKGASASGEENAQGENQLPAEYLGNYHGVQPSYVMKNQFGDDLEINGNKVTIPSIDYKFLLKENGVVNLQQTSLEDQSRVYYEGTFKITSDEEGSYSIACSLSDGENSNPSYLLIIDKKEKKGLCRSGNDPEFALEKTN
jgi:hypothetical protein